MKTKIQLKEEVHLTQDLMSIVEVMKQVAASHLHHLEKLQVRFDEMAKALQEFFLWIGAKEVEHPFFKNNVAARLVVLVTSDAGFLGGLNAYVLREGLSDFQEKRGDGIAVIGLRGKNSLMDAGRKPEASFPGISDTIAKEEINDVKKFIVSKILEGRFGGASVVYPHYYSITRQGVARVELFPCKALPGEKSVGSGLRPDPVRVGSGLRPDPTGPDPALESPVEDVIGYLTELWTSERLYTLFWNSKLSELAARTIHLEESHQELGKERRRIRHEYSRRMHEETDRNIREIVSARSVKREE